MPKAKPPKKNRTAPLGSGLVICRCRARCLTFIPESGTYEGPGEQVTPKTKSIHKRDERLLDIFGKPSGETDIRVTPVAHLLGEEVDEESAQRRWEEAIGAHLDVLRGCPVFHWGGNDDLIFSNNPRERGPYEFEYVEDPEGAYNLLSAPFPNTGPQALLQGSPCNQHYIQREAVLWEICRTLQSFRETDSTHELHQDAYHQLYELEQEKATIWETQREGYMGGPCFNTAIFFRKRSPKAKVIEAASLVALALQFQSFLPRRGVELHLSGTADVLSLATPVQSLPKLPRDPRPLPVRFNLDPIMATYVSCPKCHCLYPYAVGMGGRVPAKCTFKQAPASFPCDTDLWKRAKRGPLGEREVPIRKYFHQPLKSWLGRLLSRPGIEKLIYDYPRSQLGARDVRTDREALNAESTDIWQGEVFRRVKDKKDQPFFPGPAGELRLAFSMSVDGFQTFQMKTAKQSSSSTGIWLVLLNLPPHLRYLPQNMYLAGVIPGPHKPSNDQINHYVKLVVTELQQLWGPGVRFSRTYDFLHGRICKGMLIPVICDLLGAHQLVGYPGSPNAHYFCTCCESDIDDVNIVDPSLWPKKNVRHIRRFAQLYRDAESESHQQAIFEACGWRWSPLFDLEYWDPSLFTVIDSMHSLDLNVLKHHIQDLFQIDTKRAGGDALRTPSTERIKRVVASEKEISALHKCQDLIYENPPKLLYELLQVHRKVLYSFCLDYDIRDEGLAVIIGTRWILAKAIHQWASDSLLAELHLLTGKQRQNEESEMVKEFLARHPQLSPQQQLLIEAPQSPMEHPSESH